MNTKGFSTIELLVSFVIISFIAIAMFRTVVDLMDKIDNYQNITRASIASGTLANNIEEDFAHKRLYGIKSCGCSCYDIIFQDLSVKRLSANTTDKTITYDNITQKLPQTYNISGIFVTKSTFSTDEGQYDSIIKILSPITDTVYGTSRDLNIVYQYDSRDTGNLPIYIDNSLTEYDGYSCMFGVNIPQLATGMTPIKWNGSTWIDTTADDIEWYSYTTSDKRWANARTADGSYWVWIPRYVYRISSGWHVGGPSGAVDVQFSMRTDDTREGTITLDTGTGSDASNNKWTNHPAFSFGSQELKGIWVAKFEASGTTSDVDIKPNASSIRSLFIDTAFIASRNMETNSRYGWGTSGSGIDTHLAKNVEWGAAAYLAQSTYGKNAEVWMNNSQTYTTGCAGNAATVVSYNGCQNAYNTPNGQQASTTGNIYGIYDMSGGSDEYVSAYIANGSIYLAYGNSIVNADGKYKEVYDYGNPDNAVNNYALTANKKGDAIYETSSGSAWYYDNTNIPSQSAIWYTRGGYIDGGNASGIFSFTAHFGFGNTSTSFRPVIAMIDERPAITLLGNTTTWVTLGNTYSDAGATAMDDNDGNITGDITTTGTVNPSVPGTYTITYNVTDSYGNTASTVTRTIIVDTPANAPVLATGMTPIKWVNGVETTTTAADSEWYDYRNKKWANAKTADGSYWVWIPRYIYKISSGWHTSTVGTIDVLFSPNTDDTLGGVITLDTGIGADASNNKWTNHPGFAFGTTPLTGMWVGKYEVSGAANALNILPNVAAFLSQSPSVDFSSVRSMETNSRYGWGTSGSGIDTHMMKNVEWGATVYLAQSTYGKNAEVWTNPSNTLITGCAGSSATATGVAGCPFPYDTPNGQQSSTTGNLYGIYGMSGGTSETTAAYLNNGNSILTSYGSNLVNADPKYKDIYSVGSPDNQTNNYPLTINKKGDALYEISSTSGGWYNDAAVMPYDISPFFIRGGHYNFGGSSGIFFFWSSQGFLGGGASYRPVLAVESGL